PAAKREGEKFSEVHRSQIAARRRVVQRVRAAPLIVIPSEGAQRLRLLSSRAKARSGSAYCHPERRRAAPQSRDPRPGGGALTSAPLSKESFPVASPRVRMTKRCARGALLAYSSRHAVPSQFCRIRPPHARAERPRVR